MRSILVAIYELKAEEVCVIGHHGCGMVGLQSSSILEAAKKKMGLAKSESIPYRTLGLIYLHG
ncbi:hypothetical protein GCM10020331_100280 [Ectobacillus funiculus]